MTWHYVAVKRDGCYYVGERYSRFGVVPKIVPMGDTKKQLIKDLEMMLEDVKRYRTEEVK